MKKILRTKRCFKPLTGLVLISLLTWAAVHWDLASFLHPERIRYLGQQMGPYGPLLFIGLCLVGVMLHFPGILLVALGGVLFGGLRGFFWGWIGGLAGTTVSFLLTRYFLRDTVQQAFLFRYRPLRVLDERLVQKGLQTILLLRFFLFLAPPLNWTLGLTRVRFAHYLIGSALGIIPCLGVTSYAADSIIRANSIWGAISSELMIPLVLATALATLLFFLVRKWSG
ncbi:MAG: VTT domain-containing protein [Thermodesulfobacteriota bacterium]